MRGGARETLPIKAALTVAPPQHKFDFYTYILRLSPQKRQKPRLAVVLKLLDASLAASLIAAVAPAA